MRVSLSEREGGSGKHEIYFVRLAERHLWGERVNFGFLQSLMTFLLH